MVSKQYVQLMAAYSEWQNRNIFGAADSISDAERRLDQGAFFRSIHETLNHVLWGDQIWLHRLAGTREPLVSELARSIALHDDWDQLKADRARTDRIILEWARDVTDESFDGELGWYSGIVESEISRPKWALVMQLFNHGTHHRGQVHAMLTAVGATPNDTDIQFMESNHFKW